MNSLVDNRKNDGTIVNKRKKRTDVKGKDSSSNGVDKTLKSEEEDEGNRVNSIADESSSYLEYGQREGGFGQGGEALLQELLMNSCGKGEEMVNSYDSTSGSREEGSTEEDENSKKENCGKTYKRREQKERTMTREELKKHNQEEQNKQKEKEMKETSWTPEDVKKCCDYLSKIEIIGKRDRRIRNEEYKRVNSLKCVTKDNTTRPNEEVFVDGLSKRQIVSDAIEYHKDFRVREKRTILIRDWGGATKVHLQIRPRNRMY